MARYLLGTQCLVDVALLNHGGAHRWFVGQSPQSGVFVGDVAVSAFSVALVHRQLRQHPPSGPRERQHERNLLHLIRQFGVAGAVEGATPDVVYQWAESALDPMTYDAPGRGTVPLGLEERIVLATAQRGNHGRGFILVDHRQAIHDQLGITVVDPYAAP